MGSGFSSTGSPSRPGVFGLVLIRPTGLGGGSFFSPNSVSTLRGSYGKRKGLGARLRCPLWPRAFCVVFTADSCSCLMSSSHKVSWRLLSASVLRGIYRRFVLLLDVDVRFDCAGSHNVSWRLLSASVLRGTYRRFVLLLDVEVRFDCAGSHKVSWRLLSASVLRGIYRRFVLLLDVEVRFDCAGSYKVSWRLLSASVLRGIYRRFLLLLDVEVRFACAGSHKLDFFAFLAAPGTVGVLSRRPAARVSAKGPRLDSRPVRASLFPFLWACLDGASVQHPKTATATATAPQSRTKEEAT